MPEAGVQQIITDQELPGGNRTILREFEGGFVQVFIHRPSLLADPEGVMREFLHLADVNRRKNSHHWPVAS